MEAQVIAPEPLAFGTVVERQAFVPESGLFRGPLGGHRSLDLHLLDRSVDDRDQRLPLLGIIVRVHHIRPLPAHLEQKVSVLLAPQLAPDGAPGGARRRTDRPGSQMDFCNFPVGQRIERLFTK